MSLADLYETYDFALIAAYPTLFAEAYSQEKWSAAMTEELNSINKNNTWILCHLPPNKCAIRLK